MHPSLENSLFSLLTLSVSAIACSILLIRTIYIIAVTPSPPSTSSFPSALPSVSILLPVRNEASRVLTQNIESLVSQNYPRLEIIAVDDRSTDQSRILIHQLQQSAPKRLKLVEGQEPTEDWLGKTFAMHQAKEVSSGEWLLSVDADVIYSTNAVTSALTFALQHRLDALSLLPRVIMVSFWEVVVIPVMCWMSLMRVSTSQANRTKSKKCFGFGNFILFRRSVHDSIGGFDSYRGAVLDDCAIMERLKHRNFKVMVADGSQLMRSRMYGSWSEIVNGFGKNSFAALNDSPVKTIGVIVLHIFIIFLPPSFLIYRTIIVNEPFDLYSVLAIFSTGSIFLTMLIFGLKLRAGFRFYLFYLLGHFMAIIILLFSMMSFITGRGVSWKDRIIGRR